jgi:hypothetical protein
VPAPAVADALTSVLAQYPKEHHHS